MRERMRKCRIDVVKSRKKQVGTGQSATNDKKQKNLINSINEVTKILI